VSRRIPITGDDLTEAIGGDTKDGETLEEVAAFLARLADATAEELFEAINSAQRDVAGWLGDALADANACRTCDGHGGGYDAALRCPECHGSGAARRAGPIPTESPALHQSPPNKETK